LPGYSQIGTEEFPVLEIIDQYGPLYGQCKYVSIPFEENSFVLLLLLPSFARTVQIQVAIQFFMICRTAACVLTAVLTLYFKLLPDSSDLLPEDSQLGAERRKQCRGMWCYSPRPLWLSISSCSQDCSIHATSSFSPAASMHIVIVAPDGVAAVTVKLFDQTMLADTEMLYIKETVFGVLDGEPLIDCTHPCLVALAAASHWPLHTH
jgi:hypothetical protein